MTEVEFTNKLAAECNKILKELKKVNPQLKLQDINKPLLEIPLVRNDVDVIVNNKNEVTLLSFIATIGRNTTGKALAACINRDGEILSFFSETPLIMDC